MTVTAPERQQLLHTIDTALDTDPRFLQAFIAEHPDHQPDTQDLTLYLTPRTPPTLAQIIRRTQQG